MPEPLVSFGIPAYSRPALLGEAVASIARQAGPVPWEIVVCDDGPSEEARRAAEAAAPGRVAYHANERRLGAVGNWNRCLERARGAWVSVLHEDDALYPWYLSLVGPRLEGGAVAVCTRAVQGAAMPGRPAPADGARIRPYPPRYFLKGSMSPFPGVMMRRQAALALGGFDPAWGPLADYDFWYRLACSGPVEVVQEVGVFYRVAPGQWTEREWARMLRQSHLLRRRIATEQFADSPRFGRWLARFFTYRNARSYERRFRGERPAALGRALRLGRIPLSGIPSGWAWAALRLSARPR